MTQALRHHLDLAIERARSSTPKHGRASQPEPMDEDAYAAALKASVKPVVKSINPTTLSNDIIDVLADGKERTAGDIATSLGHPNASNGRIVSIRRACDGLISARIIRKTKLPLGNVGYHMPRVTTSRRIGMAKLEAKKDRRCP